LLELGVNMAKGDVAEALMILANNFREHGIVFPELLAPTLRRFANDAHPAIRALILRYLPYLQSKNFDLGWELFHITMQDAEGLWKMAEPCLYYAYHNHFEVVQPFLSRLRNEGRGNDLETWGRIAALATLSNQINFDEFLADLTVLGQTEAWNGAATVWTNIENMKLNWRQCIAGMDLALNAGANHAIAVAGQMDHIFSDKSAVINVPINLISRCFFIFEKNIEHKHHRLFGFHEWLNATSQHDPEHALAATEIYLGYVNYSKPHLYDHDNSLTQLVTRLFAEAEEREETDNGFMLQRVVAVQDSMLSLGVNGVTDWLKAAERP